MPDLGAFEQVAEYFEEIGAIRQLPDGVVPISYSEIAGWAAATGTPINHWLTTALMNMSRQYYYQMGRSSDPSARAPYAATRTADDISADYIAAMRARADSKVRKLF